MPTAIHKRALQRAIDLAGGVDPLAKQLNVPSTAVRFWLNGSSPLPGDVFLKIVDLMLDHSMTELRPPPAQSGAPARDSGPGTSDS
ncbi:MAG TPA: YdaS family helix-turn-helix protein [Burkholderiales bacterium]